MSRSARIVIAGLPHHVVQRGNNRQPIFLKRGDAEEYLRGVQSVFHQYRLVLHAYRLMPNHVHFVVTPGQAGWLARGMRVLQSRYAQRFNQRHARSGHLWHERFFSCVLDDCPLWAALRYIENNPVRAGLVTRAWEHEWSRAAAHVTGRDRHGLLATETWAEMMRDVDRREELPAVAPGEVESLRTHTRNGRPLGGKAFLAELERRLGHALPR